MTLTEGEKVKYKHEGSTIWLKGTVVNLNQMTGLKHVKLVDENGYTCRIPIHLIKKIKN